MHCAAVPQPNYAKVCPHEMSAYYMLGQLHRYQAALCTRVLSV